MNKYLDEIKKQVELSRENEDVKIILFGSRARNDSSRSSDIDIGIIPKKIFI